MNIYKELIYLFWKNKSVSDNDERINKKTNEFISLKCSCGNLVVDEESDVFMVGFDSEDILEDYQLEFSIHCDYCDTQISYKNLDDKSKNIFNMTGQEFPILYRWGMNCLFYCNYTPSILTIVAIYDIIY